MYVDIVGLGTARGHGSVSAMLWSSLQGIFMFALSTASHIYLQHREGGVRRSLPCDSTVTKNKRNSSTDNMIGKSPQDGSIKILLALDIGSSSIRCSPFILLPTGDVKSVATCSSKTALAIVSPQADAHPVSIEVIADTVELLLSQSITKLREWSPSSSLCSSGQLSIVAIGFSSLAMSLVKVDELMQQASPLLVYACAERSPSIRRAVDELKGMTSDDDHQRTGTMLWHPSYAPAQLRALNSCSQSRLKHGSGTSTNTPGEASFKWQTISQHIMSRWSSSKLQTPMSFCEASWTGLLNVRDMCWDTKAVQLADINADLLPQLCQFDGFVGGFDEDSSTRMGLPHYEIRDTSMFLGVGDGACCCFGSGCDYPSAHGIHISVTIGTSAAVRVLLDLQREPFPSLLPPGLFCYRINQRYLMIGGALSDGGNLIEWYSTIIGGDDHLRKRVLRRLSRFYLRKNSGNFINSDNRMRRREKVVGFPLILPFWSGERAPGWDSQAKGTIVGLNRATTKEDILFALMESVCMRLHAIIRTLAQSGILPNPSGSSSLSNATGTPNGTILIASGAGLETNPLWCQILSDVTEMKLVNNSPDSCELTTLGLARMMSKSLTPDQNISVEKTSQRDQLSKEDLQSVTVPNTDMHNFFNLRRERYDALYSNKHHFC
jgi:gluconokinase